jgi:hypothetical protein
MDEILLSTLTDYYKVLQRRGFFSYSETIKILVLCFFRDFVFCDYRGILSKEDYHDIEKALNCLFGSNCLIPYPDYLKMGKLHLGETTELAQRIKTIEDTPVLKLMDADGTSDSDIIIIDDEVE